MAQRSVVIKVMQQSYLDLSELVHLHNQYATKKNTYFGDYSPWAISQPFLALNVALCPV